VVDVIVEEGPSFAAIILDTDNGPDAIVHSPNHILYILLSLQNPKFLVRDDAKVV
jgi:hypothetical protein